MSHARLPAFDEMEHRSRTWSSEAGIARSVTGSQLSSTIDERPGAAIIATTDADRMFGKMMLLFEGWLRSKGYGEKTISSRLSEAKRVEDHHGNLDEHFHRDGLISVLQLLRYSKADERDGRPNPTLIPIEGVLRTNLATYKLAVGLYRDFLGLKR